MGIGSLLKTAAASVGGVLFVSYLGFIKPLKYYGRMAAYVMCVLISATYGVLLSAVLVFVGKRRLVQHLVARFFLCLTSVVMGIHMKVENAETLTNTRPAVFISNHQSMLDVLVLGAIFPPYTSVTAKKSLKYYPFLGWFMWASGSVFLNRTNRANALKAFEDAKVEIKKYKQSVFMFPEGTRSHAFSPEMMPFKKGAFHLAIQSQLPVVPIVVSNYSRIWSQPHNHISTGTVPIRVLDPVPTKGLTAADVDSLIAKVRENMLKASTELGYAQATS
ncbi:putative 1-acyl-sn-glycerol-3-phosphate acyltransferase [Wickerhamiella sorbophila]|uniref:1-acyl-sn-glycerol-3-phosphate acyltransferase n=1 Tax=Wickerhamiella sorbophila TaxID=45607 RepID=A0A2T0FHA2_9ASCO|nr:putative 1-acyl-sn-glycerol-3-phosphate acyltransferase [Wickerhamiella sorbophila]PRT54364.1 putative 1-acyl-sn-glycerol-3-phosphate acyltransferase [Wickerhamiella sorbophila]